MRRMHLLACAAGMATFLAWLAASGGHMPQGGTDLGTVEDAPVPSSLPGPAEAASPAAELVAQVRATSQALYERTRTKLLAAYEEAADRARALAAEGRPPEGADVLSPVHEALEAAGRLAHVGRFNDATIELQKGLDHLGDLDRVRDASPPERTRAVPAASSAAAAPSRGVPATTRRNAARPAPATTPRAPSKAESRQALYARLVPAVVEIEVRDALQRPLKWGSGFFVSADGLLLTNHHVMEGAQVAVVTTHDGRRLAATRLLAMSPERDLALVRVEGTGHVALDLAPGGMPAVGSAVYTIGAPEGLQGSLSEGLVSGHRRMASGTPVLQITAPISHGSSGGPVFADDGRVVGIAYATLKDAQSLNLAVAASAARELIAQRGAGSALQAPGPRPDLYAAIVWSRRKGRYAWSFDALSKIQALHRARTTLDSGDSRLVAWTRNGWCAIAFGDAAGAWGAGSGATRAEAEQKALAACAKRTTGGHVALAIPADGTRK